MGRRSILSLSGFDWITRFVCVKTSGCGLILLVIGKPSDFGPQRYTLAATGVVCPFAESGNPLNPISRLALNPSISGRFKEYFRGRLGGEGLDWEWSGAHEEDRRALELERR